MVKTIITSYGKNNKNKYMVCTCEHKSKNYIYISHQYDELSVPWNTPQRYLKYSLSPKSEVHSQTIIHSFIHETILILKNFKQLALFILNNLITGYQVPGTRYWVLGTDS